MASNNRVSIWGYSVVNTSFLSTGNQTGNTGSHAGSKITGFNGAAGNNNKYQTTDNNCMKYNEFVKVEVFNNNSGSNISN
ncbi:hypothetical protein MKW94_003545 [Papaver nudicaule]|uniref:Uncharacterized protein n=1 Tax=Papaver nudicaule TaxID=74823 RepID=A0AA42B467_PAPNU|nr:hypothetical protein [Papaver nudicaule]